MSSESLAALIGKGGVCSSFFANGSPNESLGLLVSINGERAGWACLNIGTAVNHRHLTYQYQLLDFGFTQLLKSRNLQKKVVEKVARYLVQDIKSSVKINRARVLNVESLSITQVKGYDWVLNRMDALIQRELTLSYLGRISLRFKKDEILRPYLEITES